MVTGSAEASIFSTFPLFLENPSLDIWEIRLMIFDP